MECLTCTCEGALFQVLSVSMAAASTPHLLSSKLQTGLRCECDFVALAAKMLWNKVSAVTAQERLLLALTFAKGEGSTWISFHI